MPPEFSGVERRLEKLNSCLSDLEALKEKNQKEFAGDSNLRAIVERNLELACQCCIDIANRIISVEDIEKPTDYYSAIIKLGESNIIPLEFATSFASVAGLRNILVHGYLEIDWGEVYQWLRRLDDFRKFVDSIRKYLATK